MKLMERLNSLPDDEYVYLGTDQGSSWLWISQNKEMKDKLGDLNISLRQNKERILAKKEIHEERMKNEVAANKSLLDSAKTAGTISEKRVELKNAIDDWESTQKTIVEAYRYFANWTDLENREIVQEYEHTVEPEGLCILVDGEEAGDYWCFSEISAPKRMPKDDSAKACLVRKMLKEAV